jgi:hypothetical protein
MSGIPYAAANPDVILDMCYDSIGIYVGMPDEHWYVFDARNGKREMYDYEPHEVEHVTCESDAEQATPNGTLPR